MMIHAKYGAVIGWGKKPGREVPSQSQRRILHGSSDHGNSPEYSAV